MILVYPFLRDRQNEMKEDLLINETLDGMKETSCNPGLKAIAREDPLIREFTISLLDKLGLKEEQRRKDLDNVRKKVRSVARLLVKLNESKLNNQPLSSFLLGPKFMEVVSSVKELSLEADSPHLAVTLGHYIKQVCLLKISLGIMEGDERKKNEAKDFEELYKAYWNSKVAAVANRRMRLRALNKPNVTPVTSDLVKLKDFLITEICNDMQVCKPSFQEWTKFAQNLLVRILLFNKRRVGEVEELKVTDYTNKPNEYENEEIVQSMDITERALAERMEVIEVRRKSTRGLRKVFVLLTRDMCEAIQYLLKTRKSAHISCQNKYVFGTTGKSPIDGCKAVRDVTQRCSNLAKPEAIRSRHLRKYLATATQILDMNKVELKLLADHMGHNLDIHTDVYRLQSCTLERTKVARILMAVDNIQTEDLPLPISYGDKWDSDQHDDANTENPGSAFEEPGQDSVEETANEELDTSVRGPHFKTLENCREAISLIHSSEDVLFQLGIVSKDCTALPELEKTVLELAIAPGVTQGSIYCAVFRSEGCLIARYIESGSFKGALESLKERLTFCLQPPGGRLLPYRVFTDDDLQERAKSYRPSQNQKGKTKDRTNEIYKRKLLKLKESLSVVKLRGQTEDASLVSLVVSCLRQNAKNGTDDRYFHAYYIGDMQSFPTQIEERLQDYRLHGVPEQASVPSFKDLSETLLPSSLKEQFEVLSSIPNYHWAGLSGVARVGYLRYFSSVPEGSQHLPASYRNRLIHYFLKDDNRSVVEILHRLNMPPPLPSVDALNSTATECFDQEPRKKRRRYAGRVVQVTEDALREALGDSALSAVKNTATRSCQYQDYVHKLVEDGNILWRHHSFENDILCMNEYHPETGVFSPLKFCHLNMMHDETEIFFICTCPVYKLVQNVFLSHKDDSLELPLVDGISCMHCRFTKEYVLPSLQGLFLHTILTPSPLESKLQASLEFLNESVACLSAEDSVVQKFSVTAESQDTHFVHLSKDGSYISCQSGLCMSGKGRQVNTLMDSAGLCPHLDEMKTSYQVWRGRANNMPSGSGEDDGGEQEEHIPPSDDLVKDDPKKSFFDKELNRWDFGGVSKHKPTEQRDPNNKLQKNVMKRYSMLKESRDDSGCIAESFVAVSCPNTCACNAGYEDVPYVDGINLRAQFQRKTTVYTRFAPVSTTVAARMCRSGGCMLPYTGETDSIHFWSKETAIADEVCYDFLHRMMSCRMSVSAFCADMTRVYESHNQSSSSFMSSATFVHVFFSWAARKVQDVDFRLYSDPFCYPNPKILACDGTHVGVSLRKLSVVPIERPELAEQKPVALKRYDRCFLKYTADKLPEDVRTAKQHLKYVSSRALCCLKPAEILDNDILVQRNQLLVDISPPESRNVIQKFCSGQYADRELEKPLAKLFKILASDAPVSALCPNDSCLPVRIGMQNVVDKRGLQENLNIINSVCPEMKRLLQVTYSTEFADEILLLLFHLLDMIENCHCNDKACQDPFFLPNSYNPEAGVAYYFTRSGQQVRKLPKYDINKTSGLNFDDLPHQDERCTKNYPKVSKGGYSNLFLWFCPIHGRCFGFHIIPGSEGRKDPFSSLYKYLPEPPKHVFYDFACSLSEYSLNREPAYFRNTHFWHDIFHGLRHVCGDAFKLSRMSNICVNTEICEQFNSFLQNIKYTATHLSQSRFIFLTQFLLYHWNESKTESFQKRMAVARLGSS